MVQAYLEQPPEQPVVQQAQQQAAAKQAKFPLHMQGKILLPKPLVVKETFHSVGKWRQIGNSYEILSNLQVQDNRYRVATFVTCIGADTLRIYNSLLFDNEAEKSDMDKVLGMMEKYCLGETNVTYERFIFNQTTQQEGETFDQFLAVLKELTKTCNSAAMHDELVRDRIAVGVKDNSVRKLLLQKKNLSLHECLDMCRARQSMNET